MKLITLFFLLISLDVFAANYIALPEVSFEIKSKNAMEKLQDALSNPENILKRYQPTGAIITKKSVDKNQFQFYATKSKFLISKTVFVHSYFDIKESTKCQSANESGYSVTMDFAGSDTFLIDNIEKYVALICVRGKTSSNLLVVVKARLLQGSYYNNLVGPVMVDMISAQTQPLIQAINEEVTAK